MAGREDQAEEVVADVADRPVPRRVGEADVLDDEAVGLGVPHDLVRARPAVAGAGVVAVLDVQPVAVDVEVVPQGAGRVAVVRAGVGAGVVGAAVDDDVRPRHLRPLDVIVPARSRVEVLPQHVRAVAHVERVPPPAGDDRHGVEALAVLHRDPLARAGHVHARVAEVLARDVAHPAVNHAVHADEVLGVVLVDAVVAAEQRRVEGGLAGDVFDADVGQPPGRDHLAHGRRDPTARAQPLRHVADAGAGGVGGGAVLLREGAGPAGVGLPAGERGVGADRALGSRRPPSLRPPPHGRSRPRPGLSDRPWLDEVRPGPLHLGFSRLPFDIVITTNFDFLFIYM